MILDDIVKQVSAFLSHRNDDTVDRLHYRYTVIALAVYLLMVTSKQYYGEPIICNMGNIASTEIKQLVTSQCWLNGTHIFDENVKTLNENDFNNSTRIKYYQWVVVLLIAQCFLFSLPSFIWTFISELNGFDIVHVVENIVSSTYSDYYASKKTWPDIQRMLQSVSDYLRLSILRVKKKSNNSMVKSDSILFEENGHHNVDLRATQSERASMRKKNPNLQAESKFPLFFPYMGTKVLLLLNIILQYVLLSKVFNIEYFEYGLKGGFQALTGKDYVYHNKYFPKQSVCFTRVMNQDGFNNVMVLCSLPINLFNEMFYACFWLWLPCLFLITFFNIASWAQFIFPQIRRRFVKEKMNIQWDQEDKPSTAFASLYHGDDGQNVQRENAFLITHTGMTLEENLNLFCDHVCTMDVILVVQLLTKNTNGMFAKDLMMTLWYEYLDVNTYKMAKSNVTLERRPLPPMTRPNIKPKLLNHEQEE